jgi:hypothetical protein
MSLPKSAGVIGSGARPQSASRAFIVGNWIERLIGTSKSAALSRYATTSSPSPSPAC